MKRVVVLQESGDELDWRVRVMVERGRIIEAAVILEGGWLVVTRLRDNTVENRATSTVDS